MFGEDFLAKTSPEINFAGFVRQRDYWLATILAGTSIQKDMA